MAGWFYEIDSLQKGPVGSAELKSLASRGEITPTTRVRPADRDKWVTADKVRGLFQVLPTPPTTNAQPAIKQPQPPSPKTGDWHIRSPNGKTSGPFEKSQLDQWLSIGKLNATFQLRQKDWLEWKPIAEVYPELATDEWKVAGKAIGDSYQAVRGGFGRYFAGLNVGWSPAPLHLRRCIDNFHHQFSTHDRCAQCGKPTISAQAAEVASGEDSSRQMIIRAWRAVPPTLVGSLIASVIFSIAWIWLTSWSFLLVPVTLVVGVAVPYLFATTLKSSIKQSNATRHDVFATAETDRLSTDFIDPLLRRNEVITGATTPATERPSQLAITMGKVQPDQVVISLQRLKSLNDVADVEIRAEELSMFNQVLERSRSPIWTTPMQARLTLNSFALRSDYMLFKQRIEHLEQNGLDAFHAYASLIDNDERFVPFLQHFISERAIELSAGQIAEKLKAARHELKLQGYSRDLEQRRHGSMAVTIEQIDGMDPFDFELLLGMVYEAQGCRVTETPKSGDQGADVFVEKAGERTVIQAKLYKDSVGNHAVQEVIAARSHYRCHRAAVVTNNFFTPSAKELAASSDVQLIDRAALVLMVADFNRQPKDYRKLATLISTGQ